jgi:L,D-transpeptidase ErfK/SrfK
MRTLPRIFALFAAVLLTGQIPATRAAQGDDIVGGITYAMTARGETLMELAQRQDLGVLELSAVNQGVNVWTPGFGTWVELPTAHILPDAPRRGIVINLAELRLYFFPPGGAAVQTYPIGIGREGLGTPLGATTIARKAESPTWRPTEGKRKEDPSLPAVVPPGPENPLGDYALYLGWPLYLIHGTNKPDGVGRRVSRGCIRMYPDNIARLYPQVPTGTPVRVVDQPVKVGWSNGELYLEVHPDFEQLDALEASYHFDPKPAPEVRDLIAAAASSDVNRVDWQRVEVELVRRRGVPALITQPAPGKLVAPAPMRVWPDGRLNQSAGIY